MILSFSGLLVSMANQSVSILLLVDEDDNADFDIKDGHSQPAAPSGAQVVVHSIEEMKGENVGRF